MERRKANKQISVEKLEVELHDAIGERKKLETIVREIHDKVNFDGGLVYQCDLKELREQNAIEHSAIMGKLEEIYPKVKEEIDDAQAIKRIVNKYVGEFKSATYWFKIIIMLGVLVVGAGYAIGWVKAFFKGII